MTDAENIRSLEDIAKAAEGLAEQYRQDIIALRGRIASQAEEIDRLCARVQELEVDVAAEKAARMVAAVP